MNIFRPTKFNQWETADYAMPRVYYGGGKSQQSTSTVSIPPEILAQYQNVNSIANQVAQTPFQQYSADPNAFVAPLTSTQQGGILGTNQYSNEAQPFYQAASNQNQAASAPVTKSQITNYMNPYESSVINPTTQLMEQQFNQAQSGQLGNAIQNGAFGGDRAAVAAANLQQQQGLAYGQTVGGLLNQNYSQALGEANTEQQAGMAGATNEANIGAGAQAAGLSGAQAQLTAGQAQQQTEQAGLTALYNQFLQQQSYPFQTTQFLGNIAEGTGALSGSTTSTNQPAPYFSDERLKEDIEPIGKTYDGLNIIKFRYKGDKQPQIGLSAQDVEKKHPEAVGLASGYKTVDYDAATRGSAEKGRSHQGGLVVPFRGRDNFDVGGYAGLSPNSAWAAGFNLDPSYLQAQEAAYGNAPWGNAGPVSGSAPYGGKSHVPPSSPYHAALSVARTPSASNSSGLQQLSQGVSQLEGLGKTGKSLFNDAKGYMPGLAPSSASLPANSNAAPPAPVASGPSTQMPPDKAAPSSGSASPVAPSNDASSGPIAGLDAGDIGTPDLSGLDDLGSLFSKRGGRVARDSGGPTFSNPTNEENSDTSAGGDIPYDSGTGAGGLDIPDDASNNHLAVAQPPSQQSGSGGGFNPLSLVTGALGLFGLADGGRVGLAGGGDPGDSDIPLPALDDPSVFQQGNGLASLRTPHYGPAHAGGSPSGPIIDDPEWTSDQWWNGSAPAAAAPSASAPVAAPPAASRDITVNKAAPKQQVSAAPPTKAGLNPNVPAPEAQPVQAVHDMGADQNPTQPGQVLTQDNPGGVGDFLNRNQGLLVPVLHGLGTMASSNSRYLGSAILQGLGGAADSYENVQNEMQGRLGNQPIITQRQNEALQSDLGAWQSYNAQTGANLSFPAFEQMKASGRIQGNPAAQSRTAGSNQPYQYTVQEKNTGVNAQGVPLSQDPAYLAGFSAHNAGVHSEFVNGQVQQSNRQAGEINGQNFTYNGQGQQVTPNNFSGRVLAQNEPNVQSKAGADFRDAKTNFLNSYQPTQSLLTEMSGIYQGLQTGPTAEVRARISKLANDLDPNGKIPLIHSLSASSTGEDYDTAMKDIAQITAARLSGMSQAAPKAETELLSQFAANPDKSPGTVRDVIIRGQALLNQQHDYYKGYDPFRSNQAVPDYTDNFYETHPFEGYRQQLEKATPAYAGQQQNARNPKIVTGGSASASPAQLSGTPVVNSPADAMKLPSGTIFMTDDGRRLVRP